ncbi:EGF-like domain-containing protein [Pycnococcus provasolii]
MLVVWLGLLLNSSSAAAVSVDVTFFADGACSTPFAGTPKTATAESGKCVEMKRDGDGAFMKVVMQPDMKTVLIGLNETCPAAATSPDLNCKTDGSECCPISGDDGFLFAYKVMYTAPATSGGLCASTMFVAAATGVLLSSVVV